MKYKHKVRVNSSIESENVKAFLADNGFIKPYGNFILLDGWVCIDEFKNILCVAKSQAGKEIDEYETVSFDELKSIVKPKEYLFKRIDGSYHIIDHDCQGLAIEIPEGAVKFFVNNEGKAHFVSLSGQFMADYDIKNGEGYWYNPAVTMEYYQSVMGGTLVWSRHNQPGELPFVDDEPKNVVDSVIDFMCGEHGEWFTNTVDAMSKENHNHYFKDVSDIDSIDVYEVLLRFGVTDPCLQHIVKKALCIGQRGHKSLHTDMKDIHDTAVRMLAMHGIV